VFTSVLVDFGAAVGAGWCSLCDLQRSSRSVWIARGYQCHRHCHSQRINRPGGWISMPLSLSLPTHQCHRHCHSQRINRPGGIHTLLSQLQSNARLSWLHERCKLTSRPHTQTFAHSMTTFRWLPSPVLWVCQSAPTHAVRLAPSIMSESVRAQVNPPMRSNQCVRVAGSLPPDDWPPPTNARAREVGCTDGYIPWHGTTSRFDWPR
jgi:hypothetical protein